MDYDYDIIFIGGGLNYAGAVVASKAGLKIALVEQRMAHLGGTCLHNGCIPSKMYLQAAHTLYSSREAYIEGEIGLDMAVLDEKKEALLERATTGIKRQCARVDLIEGEAVLGAPHTVMVGDRTITGAHIIIGTGARPFIPEGIDYDGVQVITSDEVLNMKTLPEKIAVYGDGAIGLEMASFFAASGVETELIWRKEALLDTAHPMISKAVMNQMETLGVTLTPQRDIRSAKTTKRGVHIVYRDGKEHYSPMLLVATGRHAVTSPVQVEQIKIGKRGIETDRDFETTLKDHYAIGDCNGKLQLAHAARAQVLFVVRRILGKKPETIDLDSVVKFIHTLPCSYAFVGKRKTALEAESIAYKESVIPLKGLPFAMTHEGAEGVMAFYADEEGFLLGAEIFSPQAEELIATAAMALAGEMDARTMRRTILAHPTFSESLERAYGRL